MRSDWSTWTDRSTWGVIAPNFSGGAAPGGLYPAPPEKRQEETPTMTTEENTNITTAGTLQMESRFPHPLRHQRTGQQDRRTAEFLANLGVPMDPKLRPFNRDPPPSPERMSPAISVPVQQGSRIEWNWLSSLLLGQHLGVPMDPKLQVLASTAIPCTPSASSERMSPGW